MTLSKIKKVEKVQNIRECHSKMGERPPNLQKLFVLQCSMLENWQVSANQMLSNIGIVSQDNINSLVLFDAQAG